MIVTRADGNVLAVRQTEHARLSGDLAGAWGNDDFDRPRRHDSVRVAAGLHDDGWAEVDELPLFDARLGLPLNFLDVDVGEHAEFAREAIERIESRDPYARLLVGMHWAGLYRGRWGSPQGRFVRPPDPRTGRAAEVVDEVVAREQDVYGELAARLWPEWGSRAEFEIDTWRSYELIQHWDMLSLLVCRVSAEDRGATRRLGPVPGRTTGAAVEIAVTVADSGDVVTLDPFPFEQTVELELESVRIPDRRYASQSEVAEAVADAGTETTTWRFAPRQAPARPGDRQADVHKAQGFGRRMGFGSKPALVVVDFQRGLTEPAAPLGGGNISDAVDASVPLVQLALERELPVYATETWYRADGADTGAFALKVATCDLLVEDSHWSELDPRLPGAERYVTIEKKMPSAFFGTALHMMLTAGGVDTVVVIGCVTSGCIRATAVDAMSYGYRVAVPRECVGDREAKAHESSLTDIDRKSGDVVTTDAVSRWLATCHP